MAARLNHLRHRFSDSRDGFPCPLHHPTCLHQDSIPWLAYPSASPLRSPSGGSGLLTGCPSPTPFGLGLGPTNPTRTDLPSETLDLRRTRFSRVLRYSCQHSHFCSLHRSFRYGFTAHRTLPYCHRLRGDPWLRCRALAPLYFPRRIARPVSYYALFKG